jgi:hypothetical protein
MKKWTTLGSTAAPCRCAIAIDLVYEVSWSQIPALREPMTCALTAP